MDYILDRSWMLQRTRYGVIGATQEFKNGCDFFVDYAYSHAICVNCRNEIRCPCKRCKNSSYLGGDMIMFHLYVNGFMSGYDQFWWAHGEVRQSTNERASMVSSASITTRMNDMVRDIAGHDFDWEQDQDQPMNSEAASFFKLLEEGSEPLWPGCTKHTTLSAVAILLNIKADHNLSHECFESFLNAIKSMLPDNETLPANLYFCKKMMKKLGLGYEKIDSCPNDCMLYYKEDDQKTKCTKCGHDRYKSSKSCQHKINFNIPYKVLRYFPIADRLKRLYLSSRTAHHMTCHSRSSSKDGELCHPADGKAWKHFNTSHPQFASEPRNVRLGLSCDGFNPFGHSAISYSCWPVIITPYNLPPWMCMKQPYMFLSLIIPGPKSPGTNIDVYLRPLIDELKVLWDVGVQAWDISTKTNFTLKAAVMWTISDFPAYGMLSGWSTHVKMSCPYCMENTKSFRLIKGLKACFFDCHRRFLPTNHPFRKNRMNFTKGKIENDLPALRLSGEEVRERVLRLPNVPFCKKDKDDIIPGFGKEHNWNRRSILWELPYWSTNLIRHNLDVMHIEKNVFDNVFNTVMDVKGCTKDNEKARIDMKDICRSLITRNGYKINGFNFRKKSYNEGKQTTNYGVWVKGDTYNEVGQDFYGILDDIIELSYLGTYGGQINLFRCTWFDSDKGFRVDRHGIVEVDIGKRTFVDHPFVLPNQTKQVYYTPSLNKKRERPPTNWQVVIHTPAGFRFQTLDVGEAYQEDMLYTVPVLNPNGDEATMELVGDILENEEVEDEEEILSDDEYGEYDQSESRSDEDLDEDGYTSPNNLDYHYSSDDDLI